MNYSTLHPRLSDPKVVADLRARWAETRRLRIDDALAPGLAEALVEGAAEHPFAFFERHVSDVRCVFWRQVHTYDDVAFRPMRLARELLAVELPRFVSELSGQWLRQAGEGFAVDYYTRGSYLDVHTDQGSERLIAFVVGLTHDTWPHEDGGHLEFLEADEHTVADRVAPGFGSLDLFCVYPLLRPHRVPLLRRQVTRLSINGWMSGELKGPTE